MKDDSLDKILSEVFSEPAYPSEDLIIRTKQSLKRPGLLEYVTAASIALTMLGTFIFAYMMLLGLRGAAERIALYAAVSFMQNTVILIIWLYREKVKEVFTRLEINRV